jgi:hypothetical protein
VSRMGILPMFRDIRTPVRAWESWAGRPCYFSETDTHTVGKC